MNGTLLHPIIGSDMKILFLFLDDPERERYLEDLYEESKIPKTTLKRSLDKLHGFGFLQKNSNGYRIYYKIIDNHLIREMKILKNLDSQVVWSILDRIQKETLILYGSRANGTDSGTSDWDFLLVGNNINAREINSMVGEIENETGETINVKIMSLEEIDSIREKRSFFYLELLANHRTLRGEGFEL